jgi:hypothetical protein
MKNTLTIVITFVVATILTSLSVWQILDESYRHQLEDSHTYLDSIHARAERAARGGKVTPPFQRLADSLRSYIADDSENTTIDPSDYFVFRNAPEMKVGRAKDTIPRPHLGGMRWVIDDTCHCNHNWHFSPYYLSVATSIEEPAYTSPRGYTAVLVCSECGMLRVADNQKNMTGYIDTTTIKQGFYEINLHEKP